MFIGARQPAGQAQANDLSVALSSAHANGCAMEEPTTGAVSDPPRVRAQREDANEASRKLGKPVWRSSIGSGAFVLYVDDLSLETFAAPGCDVRMIVNADGSNCIKPNFGAAKTKRSADAAAKHLRQVHLPELLVSTRNAAAAAAMSTASRGWRQRTASCCRAQRIRRGIRESDACTLGRPSSLWPSPSTPPREPHAPTR